MRPPQRGGRRFAVLLAAALAVSGVGLTAAPLALAAPDEDPTVVGSWLAPFEEGGSGTPRCEVVNDPADAPAVLAEQPAQPATDADRAGSA